MGLIDEIWAFKMGFGPSRWDLGHMDGNGAKRREFVPRKWDLGVMARTWAWRREGTNYEPRRLRGLVTVS